MEVKFQVSLPITLEIDFEYLKSVLLTNLKLAQDKKPEELLANIECPSCRALLEALLDFEKSFPVVISLKGKAVHCEIDSR